MSTWLRLTALLGGTALVSFVLLLLAVACAEVSGGYWAKDEPLHVCGTDVELKEAGPEGASGYA